MNNMDYEKEYKAALGRAKDFMSRRGISPDEDPFECAKELSETIFPELRESDDERIRKFLKDYAIDMIAELESDISISVYDGVKGHDPDAEEELEKWREARAWLEKQKEQKPNIELIQRSWYMEGYTDGKFKREPMWNLVTGKGGPRYEKNEKYGQPLEQKPAEWDDKDLPQGGESIMINRILHSLMLYREMLKDSDFEEDYIKATLNNCLEDEKWLTSLETSQKPAEWSEEDEMIFKHCLVILHDYGYDEWLKSLRPQPHWKPSEEQMDALLWCVEHLGIADNHVLESLYNDLKKLM